MSDNPDTKAALEREAVGNAAAMREALEHIAAIPMPPPNEMAQGIAVEMREVAIAALASPPRNCDVGTEREQGVRFNAFCKKDCDRCSACPKATKYGIETPCYLIWAQMPYETEQKGETNGSK